MKTGKKRLINVLLSKSNGERTNIKKDKSKRTGADSRSGGVLNSNSSSGFSPSGNHCRHKDVHERGSQVDGIPIPTPILNTTKSDQKHGSCTQENMEYIFSQRLCRV